MAEARTDRIWINIGLGCAGLLGIGFVTLIAGFFWSRSRVKQAGGPQAVAAQLVSMGGGPIAVPALPEGEREDAKKVLMELQTKARLFTQADIKDLSVAMDRLGNAQKASPNRQPSAEEARSFIAECKRIAEKH